MHRIEYEIKLNDKNRPYIELSEEYEDKPEDKFLAIELATYLIRNSFHNNSHVLDDKSRIKLTESLDFLLDIGDSMANIVFDNMKAAGELAMMFDSAYHLEVKSIEERDGLGQETEYFSYNDKLYKREIGLKVYVNTFDYNDDKPFDNEICGVYVLKEGITNEHWVKL